MYKLIALDLDGTLLNSQRRISDENIKFINTLMSLGYEVVIATGRRYFSAKELTKDISGDMTILANNGNVLRKSLGDEIIFSKYLNSEDYHIILEEGKRRNLSPIIHVDYYDEGYDMVIEGNFRDERYFGYFSDDEKRVKGLMENDFYLQDRVLAMVYPGRLDKLREFHHHLNDLHPSRFNSHVLEHIQIAEAMFEVMNPLGSKWKSLAQYSKSIGVEQQEIIAVGDDNNDVEMLLNAGLGIAMKNGSLLAKNAADIITERDNNQSGVEYELRRVLGLR